MAPELRNYWPREYNGDWGIVKLMDHRLTEPQVIGIETPPEHSIWWVEYPPFILNINMASGTG